ncbi:hypothetical protein BGC07_00485 [Piscirickettsia litoralis]|uniref:Major facilitator superfamily (MFS) profile domain-containing protein n=2 Tax=Piscirickettsia litoralis TaxID=1891921 RepID=A0ABX2ZZB9_9GAMM|nr:hypothetical protein BGC07_00485 [Piscirickettsia litoralis]
MIVGSLISGLSGGHLINHATPDQMKESLYLIPFAILITSALLIIVHTKESTRKYKEQTLG